MTLLAHTAQVTSLAWSPVTNMLASAGKDGATMLWDIAAIHQGQSSATKPKASQSFPNASSTSSLLLGWSPDGANIAIGNSGFQVETGGQVIDTFTDVYSADLNKRISTYNSQLMTYYRMTYIQALVWAPSNYLVTGGEDAMVMLWDIGGSVPKNVTGMQPLATPVQAWRVPTAVFASGLCWSNDGRTLAVVTGNSQVSVINAFKKGSTQQPYMDSVLSHSTNPPAYSFIDWSPRAGTFAVPSYVQEQMQQEIDIWQIGHAGGPVRKLTSDATGTPRTQLIDYIHPFNQTEVINAVSWSPDGSQLATHTNFGTVTIWQTNTGKVAQTLALPKRPTKDNPLFVLNECLAWSPVAPHVLAVSDIEAITIWDVQKNVLLHTLKPDYAFQFMTGLAWAPDGKYIAGTYAQTGKVRVWDVPAQATQSELLPRLLFPKAGVTVQRQTLTDVSWSPDGRYIASASGDATVVVWKVDA